MKFSTLKLVLASACKVAFAKPTVCVPAVLRENYHKRSLPDILNTEKDLARDSESLRTSTLKVRAAIRITCSPDKEERKVISQGLQPSEVEDFKKRLKSFPREKPEIGHTHVKDLTREALDQGG